MDHLLLSPARSGGDLACVAIGHAVALLVLPSSSVYPGRWIDVMVSVSATSVVVLALERRNQMLLGRLAAEARTDPLTGLSNRRGLEERAELEMARSRRDNAPDTDLAGADQLPSAFGPPWISTSHRACRRCP